MSSEIVEVYESFAKLLEEGGFGPPGDGGWSAELIAAHVAANNEAIAEVAEAIADGEQPSYDNAAAVDLDHLRALVARAEQANGLAGAVRDSAQRLEQSLLALGPDQIDRDVPVVIRDDGQVVRDAPMPIGALIAGNASFHLDNHYEQLLSLRPAREASPPDDFDCYELVMLYGPVEEPDLDDDTRRQLQRQHLGHFAEMIDAGHMVVAGPLDNPDDDGPVGICLYRTGSLERAEKLANRDPKVRAGLHRVEVISWYTAKGAVEFPLAPSPS